MMPTPSENLPNLGDIVGICKLIDATAADFVKAIQENTDPKNSSLPRLRSTDNGSMRVPHQTILLIVVQTPYAKAKALGYRGTLDRFFALVCERIPAVSPR